MGRYIGPKCRLCRREGVKLYLKGDRCSTPKCPIDRKGAVPPGAHKYKMSRKRSSYGIQLREKQKLKRIYMIFEKQLKNYYKEALQRKGDSGEYLLQLLELRLDNVVYRSGLAMSRSQARQLITHGLLEVNKHRVNIPSYRVKKDDIINISSKGLGQKLIQNALAKKPNVPGWLKKKVHVVKVEKMPTREDIAYDINEQNIVEFYSR